MILFGTGNEININAKNIDAINNGIMKIFNLSSLREDGERLYSLIPPFKSDMYFDPEHEKEFDMEYYKYVMENDTAFIQLMSIIYPEYDHSSKNITYIMIAFDEVRISIVESLMKLIQQRYGICSYFINENTDWDLIEESTFTVPGLYNFDQDKERYANLLVENGYVDESMKED